MTLKATAWAVVDNDGLHQKSIAPERDEAKWRYVWRAMPFLPSGCDTDAEAWKYWRKQNKCKLVKVNVEVSE